MYSCAVKLIACNKRELQLDEVSSMVWRECLAGDDIERVTSAVINL